MGKKRMSVLGGEDEAAAKAKKAVKLEQKKLREGKEVHKVETPVVTDTPAPDSSSPTPSAPVEAEKSSSKKPVHIRSKNYKALKAKINAETTYSLSDALKLLHEVSVTKFTPTVELHLTLKNKGFSKEVELPFSTGKVKRIAVADDDTLAKVEKGQINFDVLLASPAMMPKLVKFARVLGPKGLMPNPKNGTVVANPEAAAKTFGSKNTVNLKTEKDAPVIHTIVGKLSASDDHLTANIEAILAGVVGLTRKVVLKSTMSPAIKIQV